jgi:hypothetical protein
MEKDEKSLKIRIPAGLIKEFMENPRLKIDLSHRGTRPVDLEIFQAVIKETFNDAAFQERLRKVLVR